MVILNLTPVVRENWKIYLYGKKHWKEIFNSDNKRILGNSGDVYNPDIEPLVIDKKSKLYK